VRLQLAYFTLQYKACASSCESLNLSFVRISQITTLERALTSGATIYNSFPSTDYGKRTWGSLRPLTRSKTYWPLYAPCPGEIKALDGELDAIDVIGVG
jgi:hypothetical protein